MRAGLFRGRDAFISPPPHTHTLTYHKGTIFHYLYASLAQSNHFYQASYIHNFNSLSSHLVFVVRLRLVIL